MDDLDRTIRDATRRNPDFPALLEQARRNTRARRGEDFVDEMARERAKRDPFFAVRGKGVRLVRALKRERMWVYGVFLTGPDECSHAGWLLGPKGQDIEGALYAEFCATYRVSVHDLYAHRDWDQATGTPTWNATAVEQYCWTMEALKADGLIQADPQWSAEAEQEWGVTHRYLPDHPNGGFYPWLIKEKGFRELPVYQACIPKYQTPSLLGR